jgi:hypothetical protein
MQLPHMLPTVSFAVTCACSRALLHIEHIFVSLWRAVLTTISVTYRLKSLFFAAISYSRHSLMYGRRLSKSGTLVLESLKTEHRKNFSGLIFSTLVILGLHNV